MEVYLLRHGMAENARPGGSDGDRQLTEEGARAVTAVTVRAKAAGIAPSLILSSTYTRAAQAADLVAGVLGYKGPVERTATLLPSGSPFEAWDDIRARAPRGSLLIAGHEPLLSGLAALLLDAPTLRIQIGTATMVAIEVERLTTQPNGILKWMLTPGLA